LYKAASPQAGDLNVAITNIINNKNITIAFCASSTLIWQTTFLQGNIQTYFCNKFKDHKCTFASSDLIICGAAQDIHRP
jgi:hypothetical protein